MGHNFCNSKKILCIFLYDIFLFSIVSALVNIPTSGNEYDGLALLDLKSRVLNDPLKIMNSWNESMHFCNWIGITCNITLGRVKVLNLEARNLTGSIPSSWGNLTYLTEIRLGDNYFCGQIPKEFGRFLRLHHLNLSFNNFSGEIPTNISHCTELVVITFGANKLVG